MYKTYSKNDLKNIKKIGIIMWGLLGDVLLRTPVIRAIKEIYPQAVIIVIVDPIGREVLKNNKYVNKMIVADRKKEGILNYNIKKIKNIIKVRKEKLDLIINLYNGGSSPFLTLFSKAKYRLGFCSNKNNLIYNIKNNCKKDRLKIDQRLSNYMISIVEPLSNNNFSLKPIFYIDKNKFKKIEKYLETFKYDLKYMYLLNLGAGDENKILDFKKYFFIVKYLYKKYNFIPLIISNPGQEYLQENFIKNFLVGSDIKYIKLNTISLDEVASYIKLIKFIVTPDTGIMHLAMAFENYIFTIFTYTHPIFVDPEDEKFIAVFEKFENKNLYQHQNISISILKENLDKLYKKITISF